MDDDAMQRDGRPDRARRGWGSSIALVGSGLLAGGILAGTLTANAANAANAADAADAANAASDEGTSSTPDESARADCPEGRGPGGLSGDEEALTGDTATSVEEAVLAEYPDATDWITGGS